MLWVENSKTLKCLYTQAPHLLGSHLNSSNYLILCHVKIALIEFQILSVITVVVVQLLSCVWLFETPWPATCQASPSFTISWSLLKLMSTESMMPSNHLILSHPFLFLLSIFPSIRVFSTGMCFYFTTLSLLHCFSQN